MQSIVGGAELIAEAVPSESPVESAPAAPQPAAAERFEFTGKAGEYFGIWVVNLFLSIVTLGIYSAWAKVRRKRYFYGNTWLAGANFEYHGNPVAILKGRLLAFAAFAGYTLAGQFSPKLAAGIALALLPLVPWFLVRSFAFNAVNSSHRNLRFHFSAGYRDGLRAIWPLFLVPTLWLLMPEVEEADMRRGNVSFFLLFLPTLVFAALYPFVVARVTLLRVNHGRFGTAPLACGASVPQFYGVYILAGLLLVVLGALFGVLMIPFMQLGPWGIGAMPVLYVVLGSILFGYTQSRVGNLVFNESRLDGRMRFRSTLSARRLALIYAGNGAAIVFSLGLAIPWAVTRTARYRAECLSIECAGGLEAFAAGVATQVGAAGEEMGEMFDIDLSL